MKKEIQELAKRIKSLEERVNSIAIYNAVSAATDISKLLSIKLANKPKQPEPEFNPEPGQWVIVKNENKSGRRHKYLPAKVDKIQNDKIKTETPYCVNDDGKYYTTEINRFRYCTEAEIIYHETERLGLKKGMTFWCNGKFCTIEKFFVHINKVMCATHFFPVDAEEAAELVKSKLKPAELNGIEVFEEAAELIKAQSEQELLPCPFCGGEAMYKNTTKVNYLPLFEIRCNNCDAIIHSTTKTDAIKHWNTRQTPPQK